MRPGIVYADTGVIDLQIADEALTGTIHAQSTVIGAQKTPRTFDAKLSGKRQGGVFIRNITRYIGPRPFDGQWQDSRLGVLVLQEHEGKVQGNFDGKGHIEGEISGRVVDLAWQNPQGGAGRGFLATTNSGLLIGLTWNDDASAPELVVAVQAMPQEKQQSKPDIPTPTSDTEARELKYLGYDLYSAGKYQEAANALEKVVRYFSNREKSVTDPAAQTGYLLDHALPLQTLILSADTAGDYQKLVDALALAIDIERRKGNSAGTMRDSADVRSLQEQTEKAIEELSQHAETMALLAEAFERGLKTLSTAGIGINFEEALDKAGLKIVSVHPNMPASQAGVMAGDVLTAVDGVSLGGMDQGQASARLRGEIGSWVSIRIMRNGQTLEMHMVRAPLNALAPERREELAKALTGLRDLAGQVRDMYRVEAERLAARIAENNRRVGCLQSTDR